MTFTTIKWLGNFISVLDQRALPADEKYLTLTTVNEVVEAIKNLTVRGAPLIGVTGAMGIALAAVASKATTIEELKNDIEHAAQKLKATRPTAVNLAWGIERMMCVVNPPPPTGGRADSASRSGERGSSLNKLQRSLVDLALHIYEEDITTNQQIGQNGQTLLRNGDAVLTHCNAGALATAGYGTALGVIYAAIENGKKISVYADETRPVLQGARLTAWELQKNNVPVTVITDNMAAWMMANKKINAVIVGADRIAANGDTANKIGTLNVAIAAKHFGIPFYVAAPFSTIDPSTKTGQDIPIEERDFYEVTHIRDQQITPDNVTIRNPAFDVTPINLISGFITEKGVLKPPFLS